MTIDGVERRFLRFIPAGYDPLVPTALVIGLHGSGGTAERARSQFALEAAAGDGAIFVYPQALPDPDPTFGGANRWAASARDGSDVHFIDDIIARAETFYCIDRDRVFVTGFSLGARFSSNLGCWRGDRLRAIAPVAPGGTADTLPLADCVGEVAIWEGLGTLDAEHTEGATRVREHYATANGCAATRTATLPDGCESYQGCRPEVPSVWCSYELGHQWPPIAPDGVWGFFASFPTLTPR